MVSKESQSGAQRGNRITDSARHDAVTNGKLCMWSRSSFPGRTAGSSVIEARRLQRSFGDGLIAVEIKNFLRIHAAIDTISSCTQ
jgi:hypothetical protein